MKLPYQTKIREFYQRLKSRFKSPYQSAKEDKKIDYDDSRSLEGRIYRSSVIFKYPGSAISLFEGHFEKLKKRAKLLKPRG